jgi:hypothetical protein
VSTCDRQYEISFQRCEHLYPLAASFYGELSHEKRVASAKSPRAKTFYFVDERAYDGFFKLRCGPNNRRRSREVIVGKRVKRTERSRCSLRLVGPQYL